MKRQENRAVLVWRGAVSAGLVSTADRAYMKAPVHRPTLRLVDKVSALTAARRPTEWVDKAVNPSKCLSALFLILRYSVFQN